MAASLAEKRSGVSVRSRSHRRLSAFVDWIKPDSETRDTIYSQAGSIRSAIANQAAADGFSVIGTPEGGSFPKQTGLRRHMFGNSEIEGQDVDLPFVIKSVTADGAKIDNLLHRFEEFAAISYPSTPRSITNSSVEMRFVGTKLNYDLVPMLAAQKSDYQVILKKDGSHRVTSVAKHTEFVRRRTQHSNLLDGRVKFNECVRLLKWWRYVRIGTTSPIEEVRTTLIELLCASAYDRCGVATTYTETLFNWFSWLATVTARRLPVSFADYSSVEVTAGAPLGNQLWQVIDPVNANNNVVHSNWGNIELGEFAAWFATSRDALSRMLAHEAAGNDGTIDEILAELFGNPILAHGTLS
jgi:hypothetical protein